MSKNVYQAIRAHIAGEYRTDTLHGKEYIVVPVTALVEGVLQGMAAEGPELALAEEFGRFPASWDGRPLVMSHPVDDDGVPVSANTPKVLETYQIGFIFNSKVSKKKLILEAWVDPTLMANLNDNSKETLEILQKGEMIEVSTGYFAMIEQASGLHNNQKYDGIQRDIVPDHLAFLPNGTIGACSNADGCGAQLAVNSSPDAKFVAVKDFRTEVHCCDSCAKGGSCSDGNHAMPKDNQEAATTEAAKGTEEAAKKGPEAHQDLTVANTISGAILFGDAATLVSAALKTSGSYVYLIGITTDKVIYEQYNNFTGYYDKFQRSYEVNADGQVTLGDDVQQVNILTRVVVANGKTDGTEATGDEEKSMTDKTTGTPAPQVNNEDVNKSVTQTITNEQGTLEVNFDAEGKATGFTLTPKANAKPQTVEEFIAQAPREMQEVMSSSLKLHNDRKQATIKALKDSGRCKFSDEYLAAQSLGDLENLAELASVPTYEGVARPIAANTVAEDDKITPAPLVFEAPAAA